MAKKTTRTISFEVPEGDYKIGDLMTHFLESQGYEGVFAAELKDKEGKRKSVARQWYNKCPMYNYEPEAKDMLNKLTTTVSELGPA